MLDAIGKGIGAGLDYMTARSNRNAQMAQAHQNELMQTKFAKNAIQWKVSDARKAGVHPLFALGASTSSYSPVSIGSLPDSNFASTFGSMGADLSTAISKGMPKAGVADAFTTTAQELQLEGMKLDNDIKKAKLASDVAKVTQPGAAAAERSLQLFENNPAVKTPGAEATQDAVSKEYGDEGIASLPGQIRIVRDYLRSQGIELPKTAQGYQDAIAKFLYSDLRKLTASLVPGSPLHRFLSGLPNFATGGR